MSYSKLKVYYQGDGNNSCCNTTSQLEKKITITLPVQAKKYGDENGYDKIIITFSCDRLILKGSNGQIFFDRDVNGEDNNEYITKITRYEWIGDNYVEPKPLNKFSKIKVYHNWQGDGRTLTLPLSKECIEYGDRFGYEKITVSKTGWEFIMKNTEGGTMIFKSFMEADSGVGTIIKIEWLNDEIESEIKKLKNKFTKVRVNHGANSKMTIALPKKLTEFGDRYGYDKITFARKGSCFYLYDPDGFILLRKDCWDTGLGEIKSMEWLNDKSETVPFNPAPSPFEIPVEESTPQAAATPVAEQVPQPAAVNEPKKETPKPQPVPAPKPKAEPAKEAPKPEVKRPTEEGMKALDRLIDAALENFIITDGEKNVLLKKSKEIGLDQTEFELYLNDKILERMKEKPKETPKPEVKRPTEEDMKALDRLIGTALEDFIITDDERKTLLKKANEIGFKQAEFELYLNGKIQERMKEKPEEKIEEKKKGFFARFFARFFGR